MLTSFKNSASTLCSILILLCHSSTTCLFCLRAVYYIATQTPQIKRSTGSCMHNSPQCRLYRCSIRIKRRYAVLNGRLDRPLLRFIREFNPAAQKIWSGPAGQQRECRPLLQTLIPKKICGGSWRFELPNVSLETLMTWRGSAKRSGTKSLLRCVQTWWPTTRNVWPLWLPTRVFPTSTKSCFAKGSNTYLTH